jgi:DNA-binding NtrC family response regulator
MNATIGPATTNPPRALAKARVLVADDEESMRYFVQRSLARRGYDTIAVEDGRGAIAEFEARRADVAVVDLRMPGAGGLEVLAELRRRDPDVIVIVMTAFGSVESAVAAMKSGAWDYVTKPFDIEELILLIERALEHRAALRENHDLRRLVEHRSSYAGLVGQSAAMREVFRVLELAQQSDATVVVTGESGTGKELVVRAIHAGSARRRSPCVPIHCAALKEGLVDSELFGYVPGAFTGAKTHKNGLIARADGGTLFLDDIAEASLAVQARLERFLQEREFVPLGATAARRVDVRVVATTNRDLADAVAKGAFRRELLFRLNVVPIRLPPLRERREDIPALASHFLQRFAGPGGAAKRLTVDALVALTTYDWPGNVRELENVIERLVVLNAGRSELTAGDLPDEMRGVSAQGGSDPTEPLCYRDMIERAQRAYFEDLFRRSGGNVSEAARLARLSRGDLHRKLRQVGIDPGVFRS